MDKIKYGDKVLVHSRNGNYFHKGIVLGLKVKGACTHYRVRVSSRHFNGKAEPARGFVFPPVNGTDVDGVQSQRVKRVAHSEHIVDYLPRRSSVSLPVRALKAAAKLSPGMPVTEFLGGRNV